MTTKNARTILFASLIAVMLLPLGGMGIVNAQDQTEKTDEQWLSEHRAMFGNSTTVHEGQATASDSNVSRYAPLGEITDEMKIDSLKQLEEAKLNMDEFDAYVEKQVRDRAPLLETVNSLYELMEASDDPEEKAMIRAALESIEPIMAEHGLFPNDKKDDQQLIDLWINKSEEKQDKFRSTVRNTSFTSSDMAMVTNVVNTDTNYKVSNYVEYSCSAWVNCKIGPHIWYTDGGGATITQTATIPNDISWINITEWKTDIKNQQSGIAYQGSYHQAIHADSDWNFLSGSSAQINLWYNPGQTHAITVHSVFNAQAGEKTYLYAYIA